MAPLNMTAEDSTPLITYAPEGKWTDSPWFNKALSNYSGNSSHATYTQGATATVKFNGTGIWVYGAMRPKYGSYSITVDGNNVANGTAQSEQNSFKQLLGGASGLSNGMHTLELTNTGDGTGLDLDYLMFEAQVGSGGNVSETMYDDGHDALHYTPDDTWKFLKQSASMNESLHWTTKPGAAVSINITGDAVAVYGTVSPHHGDMEVSIDGNTQMVHGGSANGLHPQQLLYFGNGLGGQSHNLTVTNKMQDGSGQFIDLDAIKVWTASGGDSGSNSAAASGPGADGNGGSSPATGAVSGSDPGNNFGATSGFGQTNLALPGESSLGDTSGDGNQTRSTSSDDISSGDTSGAPSNVTFNNSESSTSTSTTSTSSPTSSPTSAADHNDSGSSKHSSAVAAGVGVSLAVIAILVAILIFMCCRRRRARQAAAESKPPSIRKISDKEMSPDLPLQNGPRATWAQPPVPPPPPPEQRESFYSERLSSGRPERLSGGEVAFYSPEKGYSPERSSPEMYSESSAETLPLPARAAREESPERWSRASYGSSTHIVRGGVAPPALNLDMDAATASGAGGGPQLDLDLHKLPALPQPSAQPTMERQWSGMSAVSRDEDGNMRPSRPARRPPTLTLSPA